MAYFPLTITMEQKEKWESIWQGFVTRVGEEVEGVRDVHGGWVVEGMEVEGLEGEMRAWMGTVGWEGWGAQKGKAGEGLVGVLDGAEGLVKREIYHVELT